jgi:ATP-binding cassette subfamily G (WHITE) protein 2 (SNQ2)
MLPPQSQSESREGEPVLSHVVPSAERLTDLGNTEYINALLDLADPPRGLTGPKKPRPGRGRPRAATTASHVNLDHFDPQGVGALRQTLSRISVVPSERSRNERSQMGANFGEGSSQQSASSDTADESFDFENVLHDILKRYAVFSVTIYCPSDSPFDSQT